MGASQRTRLKKLEARAAKLAPPVVEVDEATRTAEWWAYVRRNRALIADYFASSAAREAETREKLEDIASRGSPWGLHSNRNFFRSELKALAIWRAIEAMIIAENANDEPAMNAAGEAIEATWDMLGDDAQVAYRFECALYPARSDIQRFRQWQALNGQGGT